MSQNNLKQQIAALQRKLSKVTVSGQPKNTGNSGAGTSSQTRKRRQRRANAQLRNGSGSGSVQGVIAPVVQNTNPAGRGGRATDGTIRISRRELFTTLQQGKVGYVDMLLENLPWLKGLAGSFDRVIWHSATFHWRPAVGTTVGGQLLMGPDWDSNQGVELTTERVAALTPIYESPLWQSGSFKLPSGRLMTRKEYFIRKSSSQKVDTSDCSPCALCYSTGGKSGEEAGHLWLQYDVTLFGTVAPV